MSVVELYNRSKDRIGWTGQRRKECRLNERARTIVRLNSRNEDAFRNRKCEEDETFKKGYLAFKLILQSGE